MSVPSHALVLTPAQRRQVAALILRGDIERYDRAPAMRQVLDRLVHELVGNVLTAEPGLPSDAVVDRLLTHYGYRLPARLCSRAA
jgi:hypothetical protein